MSLLSDRVALTRGSGPTGAHHAWLVLRVWQLLKDQVLDTVDLREERRDSETQPGSPPRPGAAGRHPSHQPPPRDAHPKGHPPRAKGTSVGDLTR